MTRIKAEYGLELEELPDLENAKIDVIAAHIMKTMILPEDKDTAFRVMCNAYTEATKEREGPVIFMRAESAETSYQCLIEEDLDEDGCPMDPVISGSVLLNESGAVVNANTVILRGLPATVLQSVKIGEKLKKYLSFEIMNDRIIADIWRASAAEIELTLNEVPAISWTDISPFGEGYRIN